MQLVVGPKTPSCIVQWVTTGSLMKQAEDKCVNGDNLLKI